MTFHGCRHPGREKRVGQPDVVSYLWLVSTVTAAKIIEPSHASQNQIDCAL